MRLVALLLLLPAAIVFSSCGTLFTGTSDQITIQSNPPGSRIVVDGVQMGTTPATVTVKRNLFSSSEVSLHQDGYAPYTFGLQKEFNTISLLNLFVLPGFVIDAVTGSLIKYNPTNYAMDWRNQSLAVGGQQAPIQAQTVQPVVQPVRHTEPAPPPPPAPVAQPTTGPERVVVVIPPPGRERVRWVQQQLNDAGYRCGSPDGAMGPNTRECIRSFQRASGLNVTGDIDDRTLQAIAEMD